MQTKLQSFLTFKNMQTIQNAYLGSQKRKLSNVYINKGKEARNLVRPGNKDSKRRCLSCDRCN